jgi:hypothetical protein
MGVVHQSFYSREMLYPYLTVPRKLLGTCFSLLHDSLTEVGTASTSINEAFQRRKTYMASILTRPPLLMQFMDTCANQVFFGGGHHTCLHWRLNTSVSINAIYRGERLNG